MTYSSKRRFLLGRSWVNATSITTSVIKQSGVDPGRTCVNPRRTACGISCYSQCGVSSWSFVLSCLSLPCPGSKKLLVISGDGDRQTSGAYGERTAKIHGPRIRPNGREDAFRPLTLGCGVYRILELPPGTLHSCCYRPTRVQDFYRKRRGSQWSRFSDGDPSPKLPTTDRTGFS